MTDRVHDDPSKRWNDDYGRRPLTDPRTGAMKYDQTKPRVELLPARVLQDVGDVLAFGADKYDDHNWRKGFDWSRMYGAALRHLFAWWEGEDLDPESDLPHLAHALCCVMFLQEYAHSGAGLDDRPIQYLVADQLELFVEEPAPTVPTFEPEPSMYGDAYIQSLKEKA